MDFFRNAKAVRLRSCDGQYLVVVVDEVVILHDGETRLGESTWQEETGRQDSTRWSVEFIDNSNSFLRLKSCNGKYLSASDQSSLFGMTGCKVLLSLPSLLDSSLELEPVMEGTHVKLRTHYGTFLCANRDHPMYPTSITLDLPHRTTILWDVEVVEGEEEGTATNIDDKASKEGSSSNSDDKASPVTKKHHETGEGSSVTKSPSGDSGLIQEGDWVGYRYHFWELKRQLLDNSGRKNMLVRGGLGTMALVREVCADVREHFDTIAWISIPQENDSVLICEEIFLQLIYERAALSENFDMNIWMLKDHDFSLQQKARCLDNLDRLRTWEKFKEISCIVETCQVIFIAKRDMDSSYRQIKEHGYKFESYELKGLLYLPRAHYLKNFLEKSFPPPWKRLCEHFVSKCKRLSTAIVCVLRNREKQRRCCSSYTIKDEWEVRNPSDNLCDEFHVIQQVLNILLTEELFWFLYLSILPENRPLSCKTVSRLWAAKPFFESLLSKKCILPVEKRSGVFSTFQVDKRVREIIFSLFDLCESVINTSQDSTKWPEGVRFRSVRGTISALNEEKTFPLSSIFVDVSSDEDKPTTSKALPLETSDTSLFDLKHSKVLDLTGARFQIIPDVLFELTNVRYLSLRNSSIEVIPSSTGKLTDLEFLDAKHSLVTELPKEVAKLKKIRHILIYHHKRDPLMESYNLIGFKTLCRVGGFKNLEVLCFVEADKRILEDLGNLTKLMRLGITKLRKKHGKLLCTSLGKLTELKSLNLHALDEDEILDLHYRTSPPESKSLKHLYLHGRLKKLPDWILSLNDLTKIILRWSQLEEDLLATLGKLPELVELELRRAYDGEQLDFGHGQFPKLKILLLEELEGLRSINLQKGTMPSLENLTICRCRWLESVPSGIEYIGIQKLTFFDMSHKFYEKVREDHEKNNYELFKNILEVCFRRWRAGHWETHQVDSTDEEVESTHGIRLEKFYSFK